MPTRSIRTILIGPGNDDLADLLSGRLGMPSRATRGDEGLRICLDPSATEPCCAIVGRNLPDMTGLEFLGRLRGPDGEPACPVVFCLDDDPGRAFSREAIAAGADRVLIRPRLTADCLADAIEDAIDRHEARADGPLSRLAGSGVIGIFFADSGGGLSHANDEFLRIVGYRRSEYEARRPRWADLTPPEWLEIDRRKIDESLERGSCPPYEKEFIRQDGARVPVLTGFVRAGNAPDEAVAVVFDLTTHKRAEKALKDADRRKDEFIATLGHELRNPLAAISTAANVLRLKAPDDPELNWCRDVIFRQVKHLTRLIDDLLDVSRIATGKIRFKTTEVDLRSVIRRAAESVQPLAAAREQVLEIDLPDCPLMAFADPARIEQVVGNLLTNAAKFSENPGTIAVTATQEPGTHVIRVKDGGVGIAPDVLPTIFDLFAQGDRNPDRSQGGLGIGLTLVKSLTEKHGGTVEVASDGPGLGSEFTVRIPALPGDPQGNGGSGQRPG